MIAYAVIAVLAAIALWLALEWHRAKEERDDALTALLEMEADAETSDWYAKRALTAEARVSELEAQLAAVPVDAILALNGPDDYDFSGYISDIEKFAAWLEPLREQRNAARGGAQ